MQHQCMQFPHFYSKTSQRAGIVFNFVVFDILIGQSPVLISLFCCSSLLFCPALCSPTVQPYTPENVTVLVKEDEQVPYLRVSWEKPRNADTGSGWITLVYQLRVKLKSQDEWEVGGVNSFSHNPSLCSLVLHLFGIRFG